MSDILILTHVDFCTPGHLARLLDDWKVDFTVLRADLGELEGYDLDRPRAVAIMGGPMSVNDPLPWIENEIHALRHFIQRRVPLIGHCLGGQLLARALDANVQRMPHSEIGWQSVQRRDSETPSPWLVGLPAEFPVFQWHSDTFDLPEGAQLLLSSPWCERQAFAWGDRLLALQGHPEMTASLVENWLRDWSHLLDASQPSQQTVAQMHEALEHKVAALNRLAEGFYRHWLHLGMPECVLPVATGPASD